MSEKYAISLDVSIPQGTIKRYAEDLWRLIVTWFQFHKVRLKDILDKQNMTFTQFQFHKVRLKGALTLMLPALTRSFQFHKVRLKALPS